MQSLLVTNGQTHSSHVEEADKDLKSAVTSDFSAFHGDELLADKQKVHMGILTDLHDVLTWANSSDISKLIWSLFKTGGKDPDVR